MKRFSENLFLLLFALMLVSGCSIDSYKTDDISKNPHLIRIDVNNPPPSLQINHLQDGTITLKKIDNKIELGIDKTFTIKMLPAVPSNVFVPAELSSGRTYQAGLDTGFNGFAAVTSDIVLKNKYAILPFRSNPKGSASGICLIPVLKIGQARINDAIAHYTERQWQYRILNIPVTNYPMIILGREFFKSFDYISFDNANKEVVFSKDGAFQSDNIKVWNSYPFYEDPNRGDTIMVQLPINGHVLDVAFDSCGGTDLNLTKKHWETIEQGLTVTKIVNTQYTPEFFEPWPGKQATISEISVADAIIKNAEVLIYDDNPERLSVFSLGFFKDTVVVLDYVNHLMWIKKIPKYI